jgi:hypothetical protein
MAYQGSLVPKVHLVMMAHVESQGFKANLGRLVLQVSVASQVREVLLVQPGPKVPRVQRASPESKVSLGCKAKEG